MKNATRILASSIGVLCGISGLEHGFFEVLQGNVTPVIHFISGRPMIYAIGDANRFWQYGFEYAYSIVPNFFITGILALIISLLVIVWAAGFIHKKMGWLIFLLLSVFQYLVGGGAAQVGPSILIGAVAIFINHPLKRRRTFLPFGFWRTVAKPWLWLLIVFAFVFCHSIVTAVFGFFYGIQDPNIINQIMWTALDFMIVLLPLAIISALVHDSLEVSASNLQVAK
ncbi:MAG: hypothetical protein P4L50_29575 [Anaerolineaceae bacterium]|nr:hypothetical protein [Anaerolineaceae bacterium]